MNAITNIDSSSAADSSVDDAALLNPAFGGGGGGSGGHASNSLSVDAADSHATSTTPELHDVAGTTVVIAAGTTNVVSSAAGVAVIAASSAAAAATVGGVATGAGGPDGAVPATPINDDDSAGVVITLSSVPMPASEPSEDMTREVEAAGKFWASQLRDLDAELSERLQSHIVSLLRDKYSGHWYPREPHRGQAYRALSIDRQFADAALDKAARAVGIDNFRQRLPNDMDVIMWVDPGSVTVRHNNTNRTIAIYGTDMSSFLRARERSATNDKSYIDRTWSRGTPSSDPAPSK